MSYLQPLITYSQSMQQLQLGLEDLRQLNINQSTQIEIATEGAVTDTIKSIAKGIANAFIAVFNKLKNVAVSILKAMGLIKDKAKVVETKLGNDVELVKIEIKRAKQEKGEDTPSPKPSTPPSSPKPNDTTPTKQKEDLGSVSDLMSTLVDYLEKKEGKSINSVDDLVSMLAKDVNEGKSNAVLNNVVIEFNGDDAKLFSTTQVDKAKLATYRKLLDFIQRFYDSAVKDVKDNLFVKTVEEAYLTYRKQGTIKGGNGDDEFTKFIRKELAKNLNTVQSDMRGQHPFTDEFDIIIKESDLENADMFRFQSVKRNTSSFAASRSDCIAYAAELSNLISQMEKGLDRVENTSVQISERGVEKIMEEAMARLQIDVKQNRTHATRMQAELTFACKTGYNRVASLKRMYLTYVGKLLNMFKDQLNYLTNPKLGTK